MPGWNIMAQASACKTRQFRLKPEDGHVRTGYPYKSRVFASCAADLCFLIQNTSQLRRKVIHTTFLQDYICSKKIFKSAPPPSWLWWFRCDWKNKDNGCRQVQAPLPVCRLRLRLREQRLLRVRRRPFRLCRWLPALRRNYRNRI